MTPKRPFKMTIVESKKTPRSEPPLKRPLRIRATVTPREIVRAFKASAGGDKVLLQFPDADTLAPWLKQVGFFSVKTRSGIARRLHFWDCDLVDGFSDMQRSLADNRAWFSHAGLATLSSEQTATGRINCTFETPAKGNYCCVVKLLNQQPAVVECFIDDNSFGPLPLLGLTVQPHFMVLSAGRHHFRIKQVEGAFFFLSATVFRFV